MSAPEPPWLADAAEALGEVRPEDGAPLALNWTQVLAAEMRADRDERRRQWYADRPVGRPDTYQPKPNERRPG